MNQTQVTEIAVVAGASFRNPKTQTSYTVVDVNGENITLRNNDPKAGTADFPSTMTKLLRSGYIYAAKPVSVADMANAAKIKKPVTPQLPPPVKAEPVTGAAKTTAKAKVDAKPEPKAAPTKAKPEPKADTKPEPKAKPEAAPKAAAKGKAKAEPKAKPEEAPKPPKSIPATHVPHVLGRLLKDVVIQLPHKQVVMKAGLTGHIAKLHDELHFEPDMKDADNNFAFGVSPTEVFIIGFDRDKM